MGSTSVQTAFVQVIRRLMHLSPRLRALSLGAIDVLVTTLTAYAVLALRLGEPWPAIMLGADAWYLPAVVLITIPVLYSFRLYQALVRYGGQWVLMLITRAATVATLVLTPIALVLRSEAFPLSLLPLLWGGLLLGTMASRLMLYWAIKKAVVAEQTHERERVAIYGAGRAGIQILQALRSSLDHKVVALLDDDDKLHGRYLLGCTIFNPADLKDLIGRLRIKRVVLALPAASAERRRQILERIGEVPVKVQTLPPLSEIIDCRVDVGQIRDVLPEELLWRPPVAPDPVLLARDVAGRRVLVTGGGGSIGSELCRQILPLRPACLVVYEQSELALYKIENELRALIGAGDNTIDLSFILGDVCDGRHLQATLERQAIQTVYHAAAFKHVPIVEANPLPGIRNNVVGTRAAAEAAIAAGVDKFVLISTDKAVRPTSVMGASKRLAEMVLQGLAASGTRTIFAMVRFGNVINSTGSVVPLFRKQIAEGGPVTVTHEDMVRYFMTIPEAANLVLQAGALARGGEVFLLDMGEPVRIYELAKRLIHLSGRTVRDEANPNGDIAVTVTGLRPGEKLFEEMFIGADVQRTSHPRIVMGSEQFLDWQRLAPELDALDAMMAVGDEAQAVSAVFRLIAAPARPQATRPISAAS